MTSGSTDSVGATDRTGQAVATDTAASNSRPPARGRVGHFAERLPSWMGSIRFRLAIVYSTLLFGLAAVAVGIIYLSLARSLDDEPVSRRESVVAVFRGPEGQPVLAQGQVEMPDFLALFEREVNKRALDQLRDYSFLALAGLFVTSLGVGWWVSGLVLRPVGRITTVAREIQATDLSRRIRLRGPNDELRQLADTFDDMLARLDAAFEGQRRFIQEASHELRNPLAVMRTNLEVALADPDVSADDLRHTAEVVSRTTERMSTLVDDLLQYARRETPADRTELIDLHVLVDELVKEYRSAAEARGLDLVGAGQPDAVVLGDRLALRRAVANLVDNAVRLAPSGTTVAVRCGRHDGWVYAAVADEGPGIDPALHDRVFQRFWRGGAAPDGRSGLGLAIVRQIAAVHGGTVTLTSAPGQGSTFVVWLPPAGHGSPLEPRPVGFAER